MIRDTQVTIFSYLLLVFCNSVTAFICRITYYILPVTCYVLHVTEYLLRITQSFRARTKTAKDRRKPNRPPYLNSLLALKRRREFIQMPFDLNRWIVRNCAQHKAYMRICA